MGGITGKPKQEKGDGDSRPERTASQPAPTHARTHARKKTETTAAAILRRSSSSKEMCRKVSRGACRRTLCNLWALVTETCAGVAGRWPSMCRACLFVVLLLESDKNLGLGGGEKSSEASGGAAQWAKQYITPSIQNNI
ncbi:hypothetical protein H112_06321 [Trichophyton rubrum D6]|uniref:Uncharacterized protein n=1 Tax=Trichophyton rubrum CBS 288.86 TaxID=1215330 RepID=A0A022VVF4_TRIRU|nr:hypothetical protein H100_06335 [Trichophyton rubrum MR850]EZF39703.1 hypothetical protein H102_06302 [Trichophyton rubrum CBS 100081]EZF50227.1 hypothetical protein H103_06327 [Trichophyton rubrum CBS 288.86]EZF60859.1 hypothetical protein H104_06314 [Trichophyton rubrum CBS 289.86]EZF82186.1 hypothetical protein H110_06324 [Trichophyton rubrum MR1448]EZF92937.1 hypothetical protein H113_06373 [Trichophyton rubrum MR1459]EZG03948.1 hypothetical protein H106_06169 [Trichophyton rubrum CBS 